MSNQKPGRRPPPISARASSNPNAIFNLPPQKIIKATIDNYTAIPGELSFRKGDYFYVIADRDEVYEVINPILKLRGIVYKRCFEDLKRNLDPAEMSQIDGIFYQSQDSRSLGSRSLESRSLESRSLESRSLKSNSQDQKYYGSESQNRLHMRSQTSDYSRPAINSIYQSEYNYDRGPNSIIEEVQDSKSINSPYSIKSDLEVVNNDSIPVYQEIQLCSVIICELKAGDWVYTIQLSYHSGKTDIIYRTYTQIRTLQLKIMESHPLESGRLDTGRVLPFLVPVIIIDAGGDIQQKRLELGRYLSDFIGLPTRILNTGDVLDFFSTKTGDLVNVSVKIDAGDSLLDLLDDYTDNTGIIIKLVLGTEIIKWKVEVHVTFDELVRQCVSKLGFVFDWLMYCDESGAMIRLRGDLDLGLLITAMKKLRFFVA